MLYFQVIAAVAIIIQNIGGKFIPLSPSEFFPLYPSCCSGVRLFWLQCLLLVIKSRVNPCVQHRLSPTPPHPTPAVLLLSRNGLYADSLITFDLVATITSASRSPA